MRYVYLDIPFAPAFSQLTDSPHFKGDPNAPAVREIWERALRAARPKAVAVPVSVLHDREGKVAAVGGQPMDSVILDRNLRGSGRAFAFAATCGHELAGLDTGGNREAEHALFVIRMLALARAVEYGKNVLADEVKVPRLELMNPGSLPEWPISEQTKIFALLGGGEAQIGVSLDDRLFMAPMESTSGLLFESDRPYKNCMICVNLNCIGRQAPYNAEMAKEYRGE